MFISLWNDRALKYVFKYKNEKHIPDTISYFLNNLKKFEDNTYIPSTFDVLSCSRSTTGIDEVKFEVNKKILSVFDVGGSRNFLN